ncbi:uncharacterized protein LOC144432557 isoform X2 [Glandiceps talaboti]
MDSHTRHNDGGFPQIDLSNKLIIKVQLGDDIRRIPIHNEDITYDELVLMMQRVFRGRLNSNDEVAIKYKDEDGDLITICDNSDLSFAIQCSRILKLTLFVNGQPRPLESDQVKYLRKEVTDLRNRLNQLLDDLEPPARPKTPEPVAPLQESPVKSQSRVNTADTAAFDPYKQNKESEAVMQSFGLNKESGGSRPSSPADSVSSLGSAAGQQGRQQQQQQQQQQASQQQPQSQQQPTQPQAYPQQQQQQQQYPQPQPGQPQSQVQQPTSAQYGQSPSPSSQIGFQQQQQQYPGQQQAQPGYPTSAPQQQQQQQQQQQPAAYAQQPGYSQAGYPPQSQTGQAQTAQSYSTAGYTPSGQQQAYSGQPQGPGYGAQQQQQYPPGAANPYSRGPQQFQAGPPRGYPTPGPGYK